MERALSAVSFGGPGIRNSVEFGGVVYVMKHKTEEIKCEEEYYLKDGLEFFLKLFFLYFDLTEKKLSCRKEHNPTIKLSQIQDSNFNILV